MNITDADRAAAFNLAVEICGCANVEQRKRDIAAILTYGEAHRLAGVKAGLEAAAKVAESETDYTTVTPFIHRSRLVSAIRAMIEGETE